MDVRMGCSRGRKTQAIVLGGGGRDSSMSPLTLRRAKGAVPFGASYRLIDIPLSNLIHHGLAKIFVLTQYNSHSLNAHLIKTYPIRAFDKGDSFVEVLAADQDCASQGWPQGSAAAVRHFQDTLHLKEGRLPRRDEVHDYIVLSGEHLYNVNFTALVAQHRSTNAALTICAAPVALDTPALSGAEGAGLGLLILSEDGTVRHFREKPPPAAQVAMAGQSYGATKDEPLVASMGLYCWNAKQLQRMMRHDELVDFGKDIIPFALKQGLKVQAYLHDGFWQDISTLTSFFQANMLLVKHQSVLDPALSHELGHETLCTCLTPPRCLPPSKLVGTCELQEVLLGEGCWVENARVVRSVLGFCTKVNAGVVIEDCLVMGSDLGMAYSEFAAEGGLPPIGVGCGTHLRRVIVDKNARIGRNCRILNEGNVQEGGSEEQGWVIRSGLVVLLKDCIIPDHTVI